MYLKYTDEETVYSTITFQQSCMLRSLCPFCGFLIEVLLCSGHTEAVPDSTLLCGWTLLVGHTVKCN